MEHRNRTILGVIAILIAVIFSYGYFAVVQSEGANINSSSGLSGDTYFQSMYHVGEAWNGSDWNLLTVSWSTSHVATITIPYGTTEIILASGNSSLNVQHLLEQALFFFTTNIKGSATSGTAGAVNLSSAYFMLGTFHNSTSNNAFGDKAVTDVTNNVTLYSSTVNNLNTSEPFNLFNSMAGLNNEVMYVMHLSVGNKNATGAKVTGSGSLTVTSYAQYPFKLNLLDNYSYIGVLAGVLIIFLAAVSFPRLSGSAEYTLKKREVSGAVLGLVAGGLIYAIVLFGGASLPFVSSGLPYVAFLGFAAGVYIYGMQENKGDLGYQFLAGVVGLIIAVIASSVFPFLSPVAAISGYSFAGQIVAGLVLLFSVILIAGGFAALKHSKFNESTGLF